LDLLFKILISKEDIVHIYYILTMLLYLDFEFSKWAKNSTVRTDIWTKWTIEEASLVKMVLIVVLF